MYARAFFYVYLLLPCITDRPFVLRQRKLLSQDRLISQRAESDSARITNGLNLKVCVFLLVFAAAMYYRLSFVLRQRKLLSRDRLISHCAGSDNARISNSCLTYLSISKNVLKGFKTIFKSINGQLLPQL